MSERHGPESPLAMFLAEARDVLSTVETGLSGLDAPDGAEPLLVVMHRLKGAAALYGFAGLARLAGAGERALERARGAAQAERHGAAAFLGDLVPVMKLVCGDIDQTGSERLDTVATFTDRYASFCVSAPPMPAGANVGSPDFAAAPPWLRDRPEVLAYFAPEASETVHTLKGAAYTIGCAAMGDLAHQIEDLMVAVRAERMPLTPAVLEAVFAGVTASRLVLASIGGSQTELPAALERAASSLAALTPGSSPSATPSGAATGRVPAREAASGSAPRDTPPTYRGRTPVGVRPGIRVSVERLDSLMNLVGELVISRSRLDRDLSRLEHGGELLKATRSRLAKLVKDLAEPHQDGRRPSLALADAGEGRGADSFMELFGELEFDRYDDVSIVVRLLEEIAADLGEVQSQLTGAARTAWREAASIQQVTGRLRHEVGRARMVPIGTLFARFSGQVREAARGAGKRVALEVDGESVEVDTAVIEQIADPMLLLVQNAVTHGLESEDERRAAGKSPQGTVRLSAYHQGGTICVEVRDDGRGIDVERLKGAAVRKGLLSASLAGQLGRSKALDLIFLPGLSTAPQVTTTAGRGVGMDVVRTNVVRLGGQVSVDTAAGRGTQVTLRLPLTLVISECLLVRVGSETLAVPMKAVQRVLRVPPGAIEAAGGSERLQLDGRPVELVRLDRRLGLAPLSAPESIPVIVLAAAGEPVALAVTELLGKEESVIKPLGPFLEGVGPFAGAMISGEGRVILLLDPARLGDRESTGWPPPEPPRAPAADWLKTTRRVLLVDDSISVRKFVGQMLEKAGFDVITACDGAEARERLSGGSVDAVVTDLEMPRVNGFELIHQLRGSPATRDLPIVVLTTRAGAKHLDLARWLGVKHYLAKPLDEEQFVELIDSLTGGHTGRPNP